MSPKVVLLRAIRGTITGAIFGGIAALCAIPFKPEELSTSELVFWFAFGIGGLGMAREMFRLSKNKKNKKS